jgi:hypothetical protein
MCCIIKTLCYEINYPQKLWISQCLINVEGQAAENFAVLRHMALSLLQQEKTTKIGLKAKRFKAALDTQYLTKILKGQ